MSDTRTVAYQLIEELRASIKAYKDRTVILSDSIDNLNRAKIEIDNLLGKALNTKENQNESSQIAELAKYIDILVKRYAFTPDEEAKARPGMKANNYDYILPLKNKIVKCAEKLKESYQQLIEARLSSSTEPDITTLNMLEAYIVSSLIEKTNLGSSVSKDQATKRDEVVHFILSSQSRNEDVVSRWTNLKLKLMKLNTAIEAITAQKNTNRHLLQFEAGESKWNKLIRELFLKIDEVFANSSLKQKIEEGVLTGNKLEEEEKKLEEQIDSLKEKKMALVGQDVTALEQQISTLQKDKSAIKKKLDKLLYNLEPRSSTAVKKPSAAAAAHAPASSSFSNSGTLSAQGAAAAAAPATEMPSVSSFYAASSSSSTFFSSKPTTQYAAIKDALQEYTRGWRVQDNVLISGNVDGEAAQAKVKEIMDNFPDNEEAITIVTTQQGNKTSYQVYIDLEEFQVKAPVADVDASSRPKPS